VAQPLQGPLFGCCIAPVRWSTARFSFSGRIDCMQCLLHNLHIAWFVFVCVERTGEVCSQSRDVVLEANSCESKIRVLVGSRSSIGRALWGRWTLVDIICWSPLRRAALTTVTLCLYRHSIVNGWPWCGEMELWFVCWHDFWLVV